MLPLAPCFCLCLWIDSGRNLYTLIQGIFLLAEQNTRSSIWGTVNIIHNLALCPTVNMGTSFFWIDRIYWLSEHWAIAIRRQTGRDLFLHSDGCAPLWRDRLEIHMSQKEIDDFVQAFFFSVTGRSRSDESHSLSHWVMVSQLDWCDSGEWGYLLETWLMWL